jgi:hypothetical protein
LYQIEKRGNYNAVKIAFLFELAIGELRNISAIEAASAQKEDLVARLSLVRLNHIDIIT